MSWLSQLTGVDIRLTPKQRAALLQRLEPAISAWAAKHGVTPAALAELLAVLQAA